MILRLYIGLALCFFTGGVFAQVKIGDNPTQIGGSSLLEIESSVPPYKGLLLPRMTSLQRDAIEFPANSLIIFNVDEGCFNMWIAPQAQWGSFGCDSHSGTAVATVDCGEITVTGDIYYGQVTNAFVTVPVNVSQIGGWTYSNHVNGITFSGNGTFTNTGSQNVTLYASGIPGQTGTFLNAVDMNNSSSCAFNFTVNYTQSEGNISCTSPAINGNYVNGQALGTTHTITLPVTVNELGTYNISTNTVAGMAFSASGTFTSTGTQYITLQGSGTPTSSGNKVFTVSYESTSCNFTIPVKAVGSISALNCGSATLTGVLAMGLPAASVTLTVPYTGGNAGYYGAVSVNSTGVMGLTATIDAGNFASGSSSLTFNISGTPWSAGVAVFPISIGGKSCSLSLTVIQAVPPFISPYNNTSICAINSVLAHSERIGVKTIDGKSVTVTSFGCNTTTYFPSMCNFFLTSKVSTVFSNGEQSLTLGFSRPVSNIIIVVGGMSIGETLTINTNGGTPTLQGTVSGPPICENAVVINGNQATSIYNNMGSYINIGGVYYTEITLSTNSASNTMNALYCYSNGNSL